ncbi:MAG: hypothetical protein PUD26_00500 [bacterium]|nr:hypothetical protein [bacterium]MDD6025065.1 hypothetical protein [bacterium]
MKKILFVFAFIVVAMASSISVKAQTSGGFDVLGIWAYVTLDPATTPVVNGYYAVQFPEPPEDVTRVDGPGQPKIFNNSYDGYVHLYIKKNIFDLEIELLEGHQVEYEVYVNRTTSIPGGGTSQCYYYVVMCLPL